MSFLKNASIRLKILSLIIPLCVAGVGATAFMSKEYKNADTTYSNFIAIDSASSVDMARVNRNLVAVAYGAYQTLAYSPQDVRLKTATDFYKDSKAKLLTRLQDVKNRMPYEAQALDAIIARGNQVVALSDQAVQLGQADRDDEAKALLAQVDALIVPLASDTAALLDRMMKSVVVKRDHLTARTNSTIIISLIVTGGALAAGIFAALFVASYGITGPIARLRERMVGLAEGHTNAIVDGQDRHDEVGEMAKAVSVFRDNALERARLEQEAVANRSLSERERIERDAQKAKDAEQTDFAVKQLAQGLDRLANGDMTYRLEVPFVPHLDSLRENFNISIGNLNKALSDVGLNARGIDAGANEIRAAADDLSKRTEQQAASVEETAAALEEITTTVRDSATRVEEVGKLVAKAREGAERSGDIVRHAVTAMNEIEKSSGEISQIIGVIDEIAFQTNLLALNAGVEAARAGEAGKGFAVVAQEVRELAQRSAKAAKEIKALITTSGEQVRSGVSLVGETGVALETIVAEVQEINRHIGAIVESSREQTVGLQEINTAVNIMDQGTQENAAMVEQSTAASHSLAKEAASLNELLERFKLGETDSNHVTPVAMGALTLATANSRAAPSPARVLGQKITSAFGSS